jgi:hypothetical protein
MFGSCGLKWKLWQVLVYCGDSLELRSSLQMPNREAFTSLLGTTRHLIGGTDTGSAFPSPCSRTGGTFLLMGGAGRSIVGWRWPEGNQDHPGPAFHLQAHNDRVISLFPLQPESFLSVGWDGCMRCALAPGDSRLMLGTNAYGRCWARRRRFRADDGEALEGTVMLDPSGVSVATVAGGDGVAVGCFSGALVVADVEGTRTRRSRVVHQGGVVREVGTPGNSRAHALRQDALFVCCRLSCSAALHCSAGVLCRHRRERQLHYPLGLGGPGAPACASRARWPGAAAASTALILPPGHGVCEAEGGEQVEAG